MRRILAAADIGSNTAHLLIGSYDGQRIRRIRNESVWLSLGEVVSRTGEIPEILATELVTTLRNFRIMAAGLQAESLYVFATEAMRRASNHAALIARLATETGINVEIIPPQREAELSLAGAALDTHLTDPGLFVEVGGGSVQVARWFDSHLVENVSLPLGTGVLTDQLNLAQPCPPQSLQLLDDFVNGLIRAKVSRVPVMGVIASGGVARGIWRALHPDGERRVALEELDYIRWSAARLPVSQIERRFLVKTKRASTLVPGSAVLSALLRLVRQNEMVVSEFGVREGAILELYAGGLSGCRP